MEWILMSIECTMISEEDEEKIIELACDPNIYEKIIKSIAPTIRGYRNIKEAIALQLFGGSHKILKDGTKLSSELKILIVGDNGIGKSTIMEYTTQLVDQVSYSLNTRDNDELICIPNTDYLTEQELGYLLNQDNRILAITTPHNGYFDRYKILSEQIRIPSSVKSHFDLILLIEDKPSKIGDSKVAEHILELHKTSSVHYELEPELLKKYIAYARKYANPILTDEANEVLKEFYVNTRNAESEGYPPITARHLESIIRLAEASAKIKLKDSVDREDAEKAVRITMSCLKELGVNPEIGEITPGEIDKDIILSNRNKTQKLLEEIQLLEDDYGRYVPLSIVYSNLEDKYSILEKESEQMTQNLVQKGICYIPDQGYVSRA